MFKAKRRGFTRVNLNRLLEKQNFIEEKLFCVYSRITTILFIFHFKMEI